MKVAVLGCGAIGGVVARGLKAGSIDGATLVGVVHNGDQDPPDLPVLDFATAVERADLVVECAGQRALAELGTEVVRTGTDLLVVSIGAFATPGLPERLESAGTGRVYLSTGAIGGLDLLRAAALLGGLSHVGITTVKRAASLSQDWMSEAERDRLLTATEPVELMRGPARDVTTRFPKSANVAASVALAVGDWDLVEAAVIGDPDATLTSHIIEARGQAGQYRFEIRNAPSPQTPTTSQITAYAVLRTIADLAAGTAVFR
ncbi:aspartate dehydrogenase domain-containing protein [Streptosporangium sp. NPDC049644]|uniref:aspartate dehydrogenase domain-containing protein n=1 Tax=Streptosporangium sp. NPDC049644 TaxID=3155507 RepID=UPI00343E11C2